MSTVGDDVAVTKDLVGWLRRCYDDDERLIDEYEAFQRGLPVAGIVVPPGWMLGEPFDIGRQRAEVDAKRRILDWLERRDDWAANNNLWTWDSTPALELLALPYADRPGYRDEWRP